MIKYILILTSIILFSGCIYSSGYRTTIPNEIIQDNWITITAYDNTLDMSTTYQKSKYYNTDRGLPTLQKNKRGRRYKINFRTYPYKDAPFYNSFANSNIKCNFHLI